MIVIFAIFFRFFENVCQTFSKVFLSPRCQETSFMVYKGFDDGLLLSLVSLVSGSVMVFNFLPS